VATDKVEWRELWRAANLVGEPGDGGSNNIAFIPVRKNGVLIEAAKSIDLPSEALSSLQFGSLMQNTSNGNKESLKYFALANLPALRVQQSEVRSRWADLWSRVLADENAISICIARNDLCSKTERRFLSIVETGRKVEGRARLGWINRAVNLAIRPMSDWAQYGYAQYWASPLQTLGSEAGDCKDYAIVKFAILRRLGIAQDDLRLVIVYDNLRQAEHEVVLVRDGQQWLVLDNLTMAMLDAPHIRRYYPLFVMDYRGAREFEATVAHR
jgi:predicted transglutaminase-like cysteine proteinase